MPHNAQKTPSVHHVRRFLRSGWDAESGLLVEANVDAEMRATVTVGNASLAPRGLGLNVVSNEGAVGVRELPAAARQRLAVRLGRVLESESTSVRVAVLSAVLPGG